MLTIFSVESCTNKKVEPIIPVANFTFELSKNGEVKFTNTSQNAINYKWDFGDGNTSSDVNPIHVFKESKSYNIRLIAESIQKLSNEYNVSIQIPEFQVLAINIPDENFEAFLIKKKLDSDGKLNGSMLVEDALKVKEISIIEWKDSSNITSLKGIEHFINLEKLQIPYLRINNVDLTKNINLKLFDCSVSNISTIDVSKNINLESLTCDSTKISSIDVSQNQNLKYFRCNANSINALDLTNNSNLISLGCHNNKLEILDLSRNQKIESLDCSGNKLIKLDLLKLTSLVELSCDKNQLKELNTSENAKLLYLNAGRNNLTFIDLSKNLSIEWLYCNNNSLTDLDLSKNNKLKYLFCNNNLIRLICISNTIQISSFWEKDNFAVYKICT